MEQNNGAVVTEFILLGFAGQHRSWHILFAAFLVIYMATLVSNTGMILLIQTDPALHTPMYFFLQHLALVDVGLLIQEDVIGTVVEPFHAVPGCFEDSGESISFMGCLVQLFIYGAFATSEGFILASMAVDHYVAICKPLHYPVIMSQRACVQLLLGSYVMGFLNASVNTSLTFSLDFCKSNLINHFFCDVPPILALSCSSIDFNTMVLTVFVGFNLTLTVLVIILSYIFILAAILNSLLFYYVLPMQQLE
ncbi:Olfactory receptor 5AK2 [Heterocephalus glaber]|uniref:Olfactory receptor 5AK2 n=1 Tax=Heterocephalus glaber TaxID=10181 RepID=G5AK77_HETGA|nr:Olfactory receptor 5AK2 [Heterocephalus glaber]